ncbi:MAG: primosomal protein N' [Clostridia bacterium]|nr:primosomal protein N' [Clostridia bacterium]
MCKFTVAHVVLDGAVGAYDKIYTYAVPDGLSKAAVAGCRVCVPFSRSNRTRMGLILSTDTSDDVSALKYIDSVVDSEPILNEEMLKLCVWLHDSVFCTYFDAVNVMVPAGLKYKLKDYYSANGEFADISLLDGDEARLYSYISENGDTSGEKIKTVFENSEELLFSLTDKCALIHTVAPKRQIGDCMRRYVKVSENDAERTVKLTPRQCEVYEAATVAGEVSIKELQYFTGASLSVINSLIDKGVLETFEKLEFRMPPRSRAADKLSEIVLNDEQNAAFVGLKEQMFSEEGNVSLLYGVTGSGKTQVFMKLADEAIKANRGVIIMVPEIALTPQMIGLFGSRYGSKVAVFHSAMSIGQRMDEYRRIIMGKALIAIGTRSAVFAPFENLGLIVIDEEQEHTYKSEKSPRFHARDVAKLRVKYHKGLLCLSSATPSLESFALAKSGKYGLFRLSQRYKGLSLPKVSVINMREELADGNSSDISRKLAALIGEQLEAKKQSIILLNRRGHNTYVSCPACGYVATCDNCSISLTYHSANNRLMCHYCGYSVPLYKKCPECSNAFLTFSGAGTQRITEELSALFPSARILRLDADSTMTRNSYSVNLGDFADGKYDIMVGTQMVAKGLDFPNVSLVGVIGADRALSGDDYRGYERTFDLITQVIGRAGRADGNGIAVIQTSDTDNHIIDLAKSQDYEAFYNEEIIDRMNKTFPPYCDLCLVWAQSQSSDSAKSAIFEIFGAVKKLISEEYSDMHLIILGPNAAYVPRVGGKYRYRMLIKCKNSRRFRSMISKACEITKKGDISVGLDINPENII